LIPYGSDRIKHFLAEFLNVCGMERISSYPGCLLATEPFIESIAKQEPYSQKQ